jgi:hypothetical protein
MIPLEEMSNTVSVTHFTVGDRLLTSSTVRRLEHRETTDEGAWTTWERGRNPLSLLTLSLLSLLRLLRLGLSLIEKHLQTLINLNHEICVLLICLGRHGVCVKKKRVPPHSNFSLSIRASVASCRTTWKKSSVFFFFFVFSGFYCLCLCLCLYSKTGSTASVSKEPSSSRVPM